MAGLSLGLGLGLTSSSVADPIATDVETLATLLNGAGKSAIWLPTGYSDIYAESTRTTPVTPGSGNPIGAVDDASGNGFHLLQPTGSAQPDATNGATFDGVDDILLGAFAGSAGSSNMTAVFGIITSDDKGILASPGDSRFVGCFEDASASATSTSAGSPSTYVDDVLMANNRDTFHTAVSTGTPKRVHITGIAADLWTGFNLSGAAAGISAYRIVGAIPGTILIDNTALSAGDQAAALTLANSIIDQINGSL